MIHVNIDQPSRTLGGGVKTGTHYYGYYIVIPKDIHYILDDQSVKYYKAPVFTDNQVLLSSSGLAIFTFYNRDEMLDKIDPKVTHSSI
jgi:hypothetical protein